MSERDGLLTLGRAQHAKGAKMIALLAASQIKNAVDLGRHAHDMGMDHTENPFVVDIPNRGLADAWASGWVMADAGIAP